MIPKKKPDHRHRFGFTLIELLVVISIIAILAALSIVGINRMFERGNTAKCASNLKQIGVALSAVIADRNGQIPPAITNNSPYTGGWELWYQAVAPYLGITNNLADSTNNGKRPVGVFACPASKAKVFNAASGATDYGYNVELHDASSGYARGDNIAKIPQPSRVLIIADTERHSDRTRVGGRDIASYSISGMGTRHGGNCNVLFLDGHVEQRSIRETNTNSALFIPTNSGNYPWRPPLNW